MLTSLLRAVGEYGWGGVASTSFFIDPVKKFSAIFLSQVYPSSYTLAFRNQFKWLAHKYVDTYHPSQNREPLPAIPPLNFDVFTTPLSSLRKPRSRTKSNDKHTSQGKANIETNDDNNTSSDDDDDYLSPRSNATDSPVTARSTARRNAEYTIPITLLNNGNGIDLTDELGLD
jgi:CubicO group peptidase (beta-lactamase class C family)